MATPELKKLVKKEAEALRKYTTPQELKNLDWGRFDPFSMHRCIYGQMTGNCFSNRAQELLNLCGKPFSFTLLGDTDKDELTRDFSIDSRPFSAIECFVARNNTRDSAALNLLFYLRNGGELNL